MNKGFSLLEVIVAISILGSGIAGAIALSTQTIFAGTFVQKQLVAAYLAQEGLEVVHNLRHTNWVKEAEDGVTIWYSGLTKVNCDPISLPASASACPIYASVNYNSPAIIRTGPGPNDSNWRMIFNGSRYVHDAASVDAQFLRHVEISYAKDGNGKEYMHAKSVITWDKGSITAEDTLYNWKEAPR